MWSSDIEKRCGDRVERDGRGSQVDAGRHEVEIGGRIAVTCGVSTTVGERIKRSNNKMFLAWVEPAPCPATWMCH